MANEEVVVLEGRRHSPHADRANDVSVVLDLMIPTSTWPWSWRAPVVGFAGRRPQQRRPHRLRHRHLEFRQWRSGQPHRQQDEPPQERCLTAHCRDSLVERTFNRNCASTGAPMSLFRHSGRTALSPRRLHRRGEHLHRAALRRARALPAMRAWCGHTAVDGLQASRRCGWPT